MLFETSTNFIRVVTERTKRYIFGIINAVPGGIYYWKIKIIDYNNLSRLYIGVIQADKVSSKPPPFLWWGRPYGYALFQDGDFCHNGDFFPYSMEFETNHIIEMCLDLKDNYALSYIVQGVDYGKAYSVKADTTYKLGISMDHGKVELLT